MKKLFLVLALGLTVSACAGKKAPSTSPSVDPVLNAANKAGAIVSAVQSAELAFYASGQSKISAANQATVQKAFADVSKSVIDAISAYSAAKTAQNKQALASAIVNGVNSLVADLGRLSDAQMQTYSAWVSTALALVDVGISASGGA